MCAEKEGVRFMEPVRLLGGEGCMAPAYAY